MYVIEFGYFLFLIYPMLIQLLDRLEEAKRIEKYFFRPHSQKRQSVWGRERETEVMRYLQKSLAIL